ncbi:hypothetical protein [Arthrobacter sp. cf158]|uniref:hypothetical protein n=1 Tax=Arthrobacter sp. cf158 TaxID=1761744 RepID=UPI0011147408|nr:hypothetical protein [Arthrobacter sp. cf158]
MTEAEQWEQAARDMKPFLNSTSSDEWKRRFAAYYSRRSRRDRTREQVSTDLGRILHPVGTSFSMVAPRGYVPQGAAVFRARPIDNPEEISVRKDVGAPPRDKAKAGRLNSALEPLLYTAVGSPGTALCEIRIEPGQMFAMARFSMREPLFAAAIGQTEELPGLTVREKKNYNLVMQFLEDIFNEQARRERPNDYIAPEVVAKNYFDYPETYSEGWMYRSVVSLGKGGVNLALRPEVGERVLELHEVQIGVCTGISGDGLSLGFQTLDFLAAVPGQDELLSVPDGVRGPFIPPSRWSELFTTPDASD